MLEKEIKPGLGYPTDEPPPTSTKSKSGGVSLYLGGANTKGTLFSESRVNLCLWVSKVTCRESQRLLRPTALTPNVTWHLQEFGTAAV